MSTIKITAAAFAAMVAKATRIHEDWSIDIPIEHKMRAVRVLELARQLGDLDGTAEVEVPADIDDIPDEYYHASFHDNDAVISDEVRQAFLDTFFPAASINFDELAKRRVGRLGLWHSEPGPSDIKRWFRERGVKIYI